MRVSVVIPAYNESHRIDDCLRALVAQTVSPLEVIVVNNNSTDNTAEIAKRYEGVTVIDESKQGMIYARNAGFNYAQGDVIARCDADTQVSLNWIETIVSIFQNNNVGAATGTIYYYDAAQKNSGATHLYQDCMRIILGGHETLLGPNLALRKDVWNVIKNSVCLDDTQVHEDIDLGIHIIRAGFQIKREPLLIAGTSARRIKKRPFSFFFEYPLRLIKTLMRHWVR